MFSNAHLRYDISHNGGNGDWYWEVTTPEREIVARALAPTSVQARADAVIAGEFVFAAAPSAMGECRRWRRTPKTMRPELNSAKSGRTARVIWVRSSYG